MTALSASVIASLLLDASLKVLLLLTVAAGLTVVLRRAVPRTRALVWSVALVGAVVLPALTRTLPTIQLGLLPNPTKEPTLHATRVAAPVAPSTWRQPEPADHNLRFEGVRSETLARKRDGGLASWSWSRWAVLLWASGVAVLAVRHARGLHSVRTMTRRSRPLLDARSLRRLQVARTRAGVVRDVRLLENAEIRTPLTWGGWQPVILLPVAAREWSAERRDVVLLHEMVHIARFDWVTRMVARLACAVYWFNPLSWLALRRLETEQELACDEAVLAHGMRASTYATHLLDIARAVAFHTVPQPVALGMARRSQMEGRIMAVLSTDRKHRATFARIAPILAFMFALVPGIASVQPWGATPSGVASSVDGTGSHEASAEVRRLMAEIAQVEERMQPALAEIEDVEVDMAPVHEALEGFEVDMEPFHKQLAIIEAEMAPLVEEMSDVEIDMEPFAEHMAMVELEMAPWLELMDSLQEKMAPLYDRLAEMHLRDIDSDEIDLEVDRLQSELAPLREELDRMHEELEPFHEQMAKLQENMEPIHMDMEGFHEKMEPVHRRMEEIHLEMEPFHQRMEKVHLEMEPFHERMELLHQKLEPFHREMERLGDQLEAELGSDLAAVIRDSMGGAAADDAPYERIATEVLDDAHIHIADDVLSLRISTREVRETLSTELSAFRAADDEEFERAVERTVDAIADYEVRAQR